MALLVIVSASQHVSEQRVGLLGIAGVPVDYSGYLLVNHPLLDVHLLGMEVLVETRPHNAIIVDTDPELLKHVVQVGIRSC
jgi:hypothetical protein